MNFVKLAFRNLFRQKFRSIIAFGSIAFGVISLLLAGGFIEWIFSAMRRDTIYSLLGHIQVAQQGYYDDGKSDPFAYLLPEKTDHIARINNVPGVRLVTNRLSFGGIISRQDASVSFLGEGVEPEKRPN